MDICIQGFIKKYFIFNFWIYSMFIRLFLILILILFFFTAFNVSFAQNHFNSSIEKFSFYKTKYQADCLGTKITDNFGNGYDSLYGTRNMRTILFGVAYRGGANNFYHKKNKRDNRNPLPEDGLTNLFTQGFSTVIYAYGTNFSDSRKFIAVPGKKDTLHYIQNSGMSNLQMKKIMLLVKEAIEKPDKGPVYIHCWNGWHQSGYISAAILMQFCSFSNEQAYKYWIANTDGNNKGYDNVKKLVKTFKPFDDIQVNEKYKKAICPCNDSK
jgi:hypothetical protein